MDPHRLAELRSLAYHRAVAAALARDPSLVDRARARVESWLVTGGVHPEYAEEWRTLLSRPVEEICAALVETGERMQALRSTTPFAGVIGPRERWRIWRAVREEASA